MILESLQSAAVKGETIRVRQATVEETEGVLDMGMAFLTTEPPYCDTIAPSRDCLRAVLQQFFDDDNKTVFVSEQGDRLTGMMLMFCGPHLLSGEIVASELAWWVDPTRRGHGLRLLRAAEQWARAQGATKLQLMAPSLRVGALYDRLGFVALETTYQRSLT